MPREVRPYPDDPCPEKLSSTVRTAPRGSEICLLELLEPGRDLGLDLLLELADPPLRDRERVLEAVVQRAQPLGRQLVPALRDACAQPN